MKGKHKLEIFLTTSDILIELENSGKRLNKSDLYLAVNQRLKEKRDSGISKRDFYAGLEKAILEKKLQENVDQGSKWTNKPRYTTLTEEGRKQYRYNFLDISTNLTKYRRKKLFQLLFLYQAAEYGKRFFRADESFDNFLKSFSITSIDLKVTKMIEDKIGKLDVSLIHFQPIKGIKIRRYDEKGIPVMYTVTLPGFTLEEISQYHKKNIGKQEDALVSPLVRWVSPEEYQASVLNPYDSWDTRLP